MAVSPLNGSTPPILRKRLKRDTPTPISQIYKLQETCYEHAIKPKTGPVDLCRLISAWATCEDQKRILLGKGLPKAVEARNAQRRSKSKRTKPEIAELADELDKESLLPETTVPTPPGMGVANSDEAGLVTPPPLPERNPGEW